MKRFLSAILVLAIVASVMPMSFALTYGDVEIPEEMYFEFSSPSRGFTGAKDTDDVDGDKNTTETHPWRSLDHAHNADMNNTVASVSEPWCYVDNNDKASLALNDSGFSWSFYLDAADDYNPDGSTDVQPFDPSSEANARATIFELQCNESGIFKPKFLSNTGKAGAVFDIYFVKKEAGKTEYTGTDLSAYVKGLDRKYYIGTVDTYGSETVYGVETTLSNVEITEGNYYLIFIPTGFNKDIVYSIGEGKYEGLRYPYSSFKGIKFTPSLRADNVELLYNTTTKSILKGMDITGNLSADTSGTVGLPYTTNSGERDSVPGFIANSAKTSFAIYNYNIDCMPHIDGTLSDPWTIVTQNGKNNSYIDANYAHINALNSDNTDKVNTTDKFKANNWPYLMFKIKVPYAGKYNFSVKGWKTVGGANCYFYMLPAYEGAEERSEFEKDENLVGTHSFWEEGITKDTQETSFSPVGTVDVPLSGEYYVVCELRTGLGSPSEAVTTHKTIDINEDGVVDSADTYIRYLYVARLSDIKLTSAGLTDEDKAIEDAKEEIKNIDADNAEKEAAVSRDSEVRILSSVGEIIGTETYTAGGASVTLDAADYTPEGYEFLYWARGIGLNKRAVCDTPEYTFVPEKGVMNITAVFRETASEYITVEFYNMNRSLVKRFDTTYKAGDDITMLALPYMTGLGQANGWVLASDNKLYGKDDTATAAGKTMIFVADYDEPSANLTVSVDGGAFADGATSKAVAYGDEITVTAKSRTADGKNFFAYWMRGDDIVSFNRTYTFNAYKTETIKAVFTEYETAAQKVRKIVVDSIVTGEENSLIAEFLLDGEEVIERGFVFGNGTPTVNDCTYKSAMTTDKKQFSIIDDSNGLAYRAYAILADGVIYSE